MPLSFQAQKRVRAIARFDRVAKSTAFCLSERATSNLFHQILGYLSVATTRNNDEIRRFICEAVEEAAERKAKQ